MLGLAMNDNRGPQVTSVSGFFLALTWILLGLRIYCRLAIVKCFGFDDFLAVVSQLLFTLFCGFAITCVTYGMGQHAWNIQPPTHIHIGLKWLWACEIAYVLSNLAIKFSICFFLLRIVTSKTLRAILWTVIAVSCVTCSYFLLLFIFQCRPIAYFWAQHTSMRAIRCCSDWTCCILPGCVVWRLQMNSRMKFSVSLILGLGAIASIATMLRIPYIGALSNASDLLYASTDVTIWSLCETGLAIVAAACTTLRPLISRSGLLGTVQRASRAACPSSSGNFRVQSYQERGPSSYVGERMGITTIIGSQLKPNKIVDGLDSAPASETGIRKTVVVSSNVDTLDRRELEQFSIG